MRKTKRYTRSQAIKTKCLDCCGGVTTEIRNCNIPECSLYPYRMGGEDGWDAMEKDGDMYSVRNGIDRE